jgi:prepilin-type N-terminal cleavage/methylation domain-containing protein
MAYPAERRNGFTLIELILAILVIALIGGLVAPLFSNSLPSLRVRKSGDELLAAARKAHTDAVLTSRRHRLVMRAPTEDAPARWWLAFETRPLEEPGVFRRLPGGWSEEFALPETVRFASTEGARTDAETGDAYVEFNPDGTATEATIVVENDRGDRVTLQVAGATGRAVIPAEEEP